MHARYKMAFKIPFGLSILPVGQPQPQPFKYFALDATGHLGKLHSFLTPYQKAVFSFMLQLVYPLTDIPIIHFYMRLLYLQPVRM